MNGLENTRSAKACAWRYQLNSKLGSYSCQQVGFSYDPLTGFFDYYLNSPLRTVAGGQATIYCADNDSIDNPFLCSSVVQNFTDLNTFTYESTFLFVNADSLALSPGSYIIVQLLVNFQSPCETVGIRNVVVRPSCDLKSFYEFY